jgi:hypothetical protein
MPHACRSWHITPLTVVRQYDEACRARTGSAFADWTRAVEKTPIDDVAWTKEVQRRVRLEEYLRFPERFAPRGE